MQSLPGGPLPAHQACLRPTCLAREASPGHAYIALRTRELRTRTRFSLAENRVQNGTAGVMAPPASTGVSVRLKRVGNTVHIFELW